MPAATADEIRLSAPDGWVLGMRVFRPAGAPRGALLCGHAMMTDGAYFDRPRGGGFASWMAARGWSVYVPDFRGHGRSGPRADEGARWTFDDLVLHDWPALRRAAAEDAGVPDADLCVLGHSLGGLVTAADAARHGFRGRRTIFLTTNVWNVSALGLDREGLRARAVRSLMRLLTTGGRPLPVRRLRFGNHDEAAPYVRQITTWWQNGSFRSLDGLDYASALEGWNRDAVAVAGTGDWMCPPGAAGAFTGGRIPLHVEGRRSGLSFDPDHFQLLTREAGNPFQQRVLRFLETGTWA